MCIEYNIKSIYCFSQIRMQLLLNKNYKLLNEYNDAVKKYLSNQKINYNAEYECDGDKINALLVENKELKNLLAARTDQLNKLLLKRKNELATLKQTIGELRILLDGIKNRICNNMN